MATPASNNVGKMEAVVANLINREINVSDQTDLDLLLRIVDAFKNHWQTEFDAAVADPENPTNAELTGFFLAKMKEFGKAILRGEAERAEKISVQDDITLAGDTAEADLD